MKVLLSIKPEYAKKIFNGEKLYEFRRVIWKNSDVIRVVLYASAPTGKVVGEFEIGGIDDGRPVDLWDRFKHGAGMSKESFFKYFSGKDIGHAIGFRVVWAFVTPEPLSDYGISRPPQNFMYIGENIK